MRKAKCGDVLIFAGLGGTDLDKLEHLYNKPFPNNQHGAIHTYAIFITKQKKQGWVSAEEYALIWKPFIGFRWVMVYEGISNIRISHAEKYYTRIIDRELEIVNLDLRCSVLEVKQKDFNKWRGDELTSKLIEHLSQPEMIQLFQQHIREIAEQVNKGRWKPEQEIFFQPFKSDTTPKLP